MAGKSPHEAVANFLHPLQSVIACFTNAVLDHRGGYDAGRQHVVLLHDDQPVALRGNTGLELYLAHRYEVIRTDDRERGPWKVRTLGYRYRLSRANDHAELFSYHWHPEGRIKHPHLHIHPRTAVFADEFQRAHFQTGRIALEDLLELAVDAFGVLPLPARATDWQSTLNDSRARFLRFRTW